MKYFIIAGLLLFTNIKLMAQENSGPVIHDADGFTIIKDAAYQPEKNRIYKAIYDATKMAKDSSQILPALNMAGSELNALQVCSIPLSNAKFVVVFHGAAINGILNNVVYREKYGIDNPNLKTLRELKENGVQLFVCGQNLLGEKIDFKNISPDVKVASDALIVLMTFQNSGYALMSF